jgi:hypothetical protein
LNFVHNHQFVINIIIFVASEIAPWEGASSAVTSQWHESELEELTSVGHEMIVTLGTWFAEVISVNILYIEICTYIYLWVDISDHLQFEIL